MFLTYLFVSAWLCTMLRRWTRLDIGIMLAVILSAMILFAICIVLIWLWRKEEWPAEERVRAAKFDGTAESS